MNYNNKRVRIEVYGQVQGVGFRPTVYRYAKEHNLTGFTYNTPEGVIIEVEGEEVNINSFLEKLKTFPPPQADITNLKIYPLQLLNTTKFEILPSSDNLEVKTQISPDIATCAECLIELFSPTNRRYLYPFINCTNCGPRFTIIKDIPYDRCNTTMKVFNMCKECYEEYTTPIDRRFHAQPNACFRCGPEVELIPLGKNVEQTFPSTKGNNAIEQTIQLLIAGKIVAIKGIGGFHLACDALNEETVERLRKRKYREDKPFALMAKDINVIKQYCEVAKEEEELLTSSKRPIVLLKKKQGQGEKVAEQVAPNNKYLGFMLPYTPLHHLLFHSPLTVLVMTSGNISDEPIAYENEDALQRLKDIADYCLLHNRDIYIRCDDTVTRILPMTNQEMLIRRSRSYVPKPIKVNFKFRTEILACGAHLKNTFCFAKEDNVIISHHIGDLENLETLTAYEKGIEHFQKVFELQPKVIAYDMHPEYLSTKYAVTKCKVQNVKCKNIPVQHHHAHIVSCMADNEVHNHNIIGVAFDGTGYGEDKNIWGAEVLITNFSNYTRIAHLKYIPLPGGDATIKEPWRTAATYLYHIYGEEFLQLNSEFVKRLNKNKWKILQNMIDKNINCIPTSSMGRLFDCIAALIGVRDRINYEGQAAAELEQLIDDENATTTYYQYEIEKENALLIINPKNIVSGVIEDLKKSLPGSIISLKFHNTIVEIVINICKIIRNELKLNEVALSGGVFQNMVLLNKIFKHLIDANFKVYVHNKVPPNDGGICLGQAVIANHKIE